MGAMESGIVLFVLAAFVGISTVSGQLRNTCQCFPGQRFFYEYATCQLTPDPNQRQARFIRGTVRLRQKSCYWCKEAIEISVKLSGLPFVAGASTHKHGFHIHEQGDLSGGCSSAAGHYNPFSVSHGAPDSPDRHVGDLGNVVADASGGIEEYFIDEIVSITGNIGVLGRSIVLHAGEDDLGLGGNAGSLKTGNAGARLACCVIGRATNSSWVQPSVPLTRQRIGENRVERCSWYLRRLFPRWCGAWFAGPY